MRQPSPWRASVGFAIIIGASIVSFVASAQKPPPPPPPNQGVKTYMIRQDESDCNNSNVNANNPSLIGGSVWVLRQSNGSTAVQVEITGTPNTTYNFYHKCVGQLGTITTQDEGVGGATFTTNMSAGLVTFDMYPNGAPSGNKFQSVPITVQ